MIAHRRQRRRRNELDHGLIITSMVDMFTLVLLFLLVFYDPGYQSDAEVQLPDATVQRPVEKGATVRISPDAVIVAGQTAAPVVNGGFGVGVARQGTAVVPVVDALTRLRESTPLAEGQSEPVLLVQCDKRVPWTVLRAVLESAAVAGYPRYRFVVLGGE